MRPVTRSGGGGAQFAVALCTLAEEREERGRGAVLSAQRRLERVASMSKEMASGFRHAVVIGGVGLTLTRSR
jgi:hypothetical protein